MGRREHRSRCHCEGACREVAAGGSEMVSRLDDVEDSDPQPPVRAGPERLDAFDDGNAVGTWRDGRSRHDLDGLSRTDGHSWCRAGPEDPDDGQVHWGAGRIAGPDGVSVHRRVGERRDVLGCDDVGGEHTSERLVDRQVHGRQWPRRFERQALHFGEGNERFVVVTWHGVPPIGPPASMNTGPTRLPGGSPGIHLALTR